MWQAKLQRHRIEIVCAIAAIGYLVVFIGLPYANVFAFSFWEKDLYTLRPALSPENYARAFTNDLYRQVILNSAEVATIVTLVSSVLGYLLAYYLAVYAERWRNLLFFLLIVPLWTSFLLRAYIWKIILGRNGILNSALTQAGVLDQPASFLLYNKFSISIALIYIFLPFVALPVYAALEKIPRGYVEASADLGSPPWATFWHVVFPLTVPGLAAGAMVVFCLSFGDFITPSLLGGTGDIMIANVIIAQFGAAYDWPFGSALAILVLLIVMLLVGLSVWIGRTVSRGRA
ncbi:ABC transporter permease [Virgifigura deserti]|uniref:ABC transporter permease n=1 Tax=Virgifigura deserti TaxID=2268457 RepID=UPI003CCC45B3